MAIQGNKYLQMLYHSDSSFSLQLYIHVTYISIWSDGVAQLVEHWTRDSITRGLNPARSTRKPCQEHKKIRELF